MPAFSRTIALCARSLLGTSVATTSLDSIRRWVIARPSTTKRPWPEDQRMECQLNRVKIPPLRAPLNRKPLGGGGQNSRYWPQETDHGACVRAQAYLDRHSLL